MKVLVIGSGGREHALVWKMAQSPHNPQLFCAPGNPGIAEMAICVQISVEDIDGLLEFALAQAIDLTVVGPEAALAKGVVDRFQEAGLRIFGPNQAAAQIESSKAWAKQLMMEAGVPTAAYRVFSDLEEAKAYIHTQETPIVLKADGLAAGKGVIIAHTEEEALEAIDQMMQDQVFGKACTQVVVEQFLEGPEATIMAFVDGLTYRMMEPVQDHKPVFEGNKGPNTGGMGTYSPVPDVTNDVLQDVQLRIIEPTLQALHKKGIVYKGVLYVGIMITKDGPYVIEFNARFGDPETQVILPRLDTDLIDIFYSIIDASQNSPIASVPLSSLPIQWNEDNAVCVVLTAKGYPGPYDTGQVISGLSSYEHTSNSNQAVVFHAGTARSEQGIISHGGRVLGVTSLGTNLADARSNVYDRITSIHFDGMHMRSDIALQATEKQK